MKKKMRSFLYLGLLPLILSGILFLNGYANAEEIKEVKSKDGLSAYLIEDHQNPLISIAISFKAGWANEPKDKAGLVTLLQSMLNEGAGPLTSEEFQKTLADNGIEFSADSSADDIAISMTFLTEEKNHAANLLHLVLTQLRFDEDALTRNRQQMLAALSQNRNDPDWLASKILQQQIFGTDPYGKGGIYSEESLKGITKTDLQQFAATHFVKKDLHISAVGDLSEEELREWMGAAFADLPLDSKAAIVASPFAFNPKGGVGVFPRDIPQSVIVFSGPGISKDDPDFYAAYLLNHILGGDGFGSRLMQEIRVKRGLSYGIGTDLVTRDRANLLSGSVSTKRASTKETIDLIKNIFQDMHDHGPSAEELERAKTYIIGFYPRNFATIESSAQLLLGLQTDNLGIDYPERRRQLYEKVTLEDMKRVAKRLLDPEKLTFIIVGQPDLKSDFTVPSLQP